MSVYIKQFFNNILNYSDEDASTIAMSELDHQLNELNTEDLLSVFSSDETRKYKVDLKHKVYIAALAEYVYNQAGVKPPDWVFSDYFILPKVTYSDSIEIGSRFLKTKSLKLFCNENAIPEFKRRNYMITEVLNSV